MVTGGGESSTSPLLLDLEQMRFWKLVQEGPVDCSQLVPSYLNLILFFILYIQMFMWLLKVRGNINPLKLMLIAKMLKDWDVTG